jgi:hypothetical protein
VAQRHLTPNALCDWLWPLFGKHHGQQLLALLTCEYHLILVPAETARYSRSK